MALLDLVLIWTAIIAVGVFLYVLLDGFDLGVGMLYGFAPADQRALLMNSIAPIWDGNETWLILGGVALLAVFPVAFAIIIPAVYFPVLLMLLALVFRGVAFEFRFEHPMARRFWSWGFCIGSSVAAFAQGAVLGAFIQGFTVQGREFSGTSWDWLTPFSVLTGLGLMCGYGLLGAGWLIIKTEGLLQAWARQAGRVCLGGVLLAILAVSVWTPLADAAIAQRWFGWPHMLLLSRAAADSRRGVCGLARAWRLGRRRGAVSRRDRSVPAVLSRHRHQPVADDRAGSFHALAGRLVGGHAGIPSGRDPAAAAGDPDVHGVVVLGLPRQDARRRRLPLGRPGFAHGSADQPHRLRPSGRDRRLLRRSPAVEHVRHHGQQSRADAGRPARRPLAAAHDPQGQPHRNRPLLLRTLAQVFSLRRYLIVNALLFLIFSIACAHAQNLQQMVILRAIQGFSGGVLIPMAFTIIITLLPMPPIPDTPLRISAITLVTAQLSRRQPGSCGWRGWMSPVRPAASTSNKNGCRGDDPRRRLR